MNNIFILPRVLRSSKNCLYNRSVYSLKWKSSSSSSGSSSSDEDVKKEKRPEPRKKNQEALDKLNTLLQTMVDVSPAAEPLNLAKPKSKRREKGKSTKKLDTTEEKIVSAAKNVAESLGGDVKKTESELIMKLLNPIEGEQEKTLNDLMKGMQIEREQPKDELSRANQVRAILQKTRQDQQFSKKTMRSTSKEMEKVDLFGSEGLGIFSAEDGKGSEGVKNATWDHLYERDLKLAVTHPPRNYFQQIILWTKQGKMWKFPIDNEQGLEKEQNVYFTEHVFLEQHLEGWCPTKGPLRHFMELVCVGLSKNPYLTVEAKKEHIDWYRKYFEDKKQLLVDLGALQHAPKETKKIEA